MTVNRSILTGLRIMFQLDENLRSIAPPPKKSVSTELGSSNGDWPEIPCTGFREKKGRLEPDDYMI